jgi:hypothetical protein
MSGELILVVDDEPNIVQLPVPETGRIWVVPGQMVYPLEQSTRNPRWLSPI